MAKPMMVRQTSKTPTQNSANWSRAICGHHAQRHAEKETEDHEGNHAAIACSGLKALTASSSGFWGIRFEEGGGERLRGLGLGRSFRQRLARTISPGSRELLLADVSPGRNDVHKSDPDDHTRCGKDDGRDDTTDAHAAKVAGITELQHAEHDGREDERHDHHEDDAEKEHCRWDG
jgi:hypothetical protein